MIILTIRTDNPEAEIGLFDGDTKVAYEAWQAHRQLAETLHKKIAELLKSAGKGLTDLEAIVAYQGPGSFTGLRIGLTVANTLAYAENIPIVAAMTDDWISLGSGRLLRGENDKMAMPEYGAEVHITQQKK
jgi:tRNA threonylcarbamoyladenosine biosynthesis protein TsaB